MYCLFEVTYNVFFLLKCTTYLPLSIWIIFIFKVYCWNLSYLFLIKKKLSFLCLQLCRKWIYIHINLIIGFFTLNEISECDWPSMIYVEWCYQKDECEGGWCFSLFILSLCMVPIIYQSSMNPSIHLSYALIVGLSRP